MEIVELIIINRGSGRENNKNQCISISNLCTLPKNNQEKKEQGLVTKKGLFGIK
jgi:hypothetical protein